MEYRIWNIQWDTEQEDGSTPDPKALSLPSEELFEGDPEDIADFLCNKYGYCVEGYRFRERAGSFNR